VFSFGDSVQLDDYQEFRDGSETRDFGYYFFVGFLSGNLVPSKVGSDIDELILFRSSVSSSLIEHISISIIFSYLSRLCFGVFISETLCMYVCAVPHGIIPHVFKLLAPMPQLKH
jgi:hypothetical protein